MGHKSENHYLEGGNLLVVSQCVRMRSEVVLPRRKLCIEQETDDTSLRRLPEGTAS